MLVKAQTKKNPGEKEGRGKEGVMTEKKKGKRRRSILPLPSPLFSSTGQRNGRGKKTELRKRQEKEDYLTSKIHNNWLSGSGRENDVGTESESTVLLRWVGSLIREKEEEEEKGEEEKKEKRRKKERRKQMSKNHSLKERRRK